MEPTQTVEAPALLDDIEMRTASGTAWQPGEAPMHGAHGMAGPFMLMGHANVFAAYDAQGSDRGGGQFASVNWAMGHATVGMGATRLQARAMLSLEPLTVGGAGYPLLGQTGETWQGEPLTDAQHPHDLFMELALVGRQSIGDVAGVELYVAPAGEPALGPVAFPHRASAISDPLAPITHHWLDSTHISFGVLTAGVFSRWGKVEGSWFNGREPDEQRWDLDLGVPDSWSGRVTVNPGEMLSVQASYGYLPSPESLEPGVAVQRITASVAYDHDLDGEGNLAAMVSWGRNVPEGADPSDALLVEANWSAGKHVNLFGRAEYALKSAVDLGVDGTSHALASFALGHVYTIMPTRGLMVGLGLRGNLLVVPADLEAAYGTRVPVGGAVFVQVRPGESESMTMSAAPDDPSMGGHGH